MLSGTSAGMVRVFATADCATGPFTQVFCQSSGTNNQSVGSVLVTGLTPGTLYYVAVSGYGSTDLPGPFVVTRNRAQAQSHALLVYPNPSNTGQLTLQISSFRGAGQTTLLNALGQTVRQLALPQGTTEQMLSTRGLAAGVYILRVQIGADVLTRKVVLE